MEYVDVYLKANLSETSSTVGTTTNRNGFYDIVYPKQDSFVLVCSMLGYQTVEQLVVSPSDVLNINVMMLEDTILLDEIEIRSIRQNESMLESGDVSIGKNIPSVNGSNIESILITFAGVNQNNELSSQYNVRGGNFDENQVYVNGMEIRRPLLVRSGQQEGLSFVNPNMVKKLEFSAGGYGVRYGDKMSSVLDIEYKRPEHFESSISASLLGADFYLGSGNSRYSQMHGVRYKTSTYMLGGLKTEGSYNPTFLDYQTCLSWRLGNRDKWDISLIGYVAQNVYNFYPEQSSVAFGTMDKAMRHDVLYDGKERDKFFSSFGALSLHGKPVDNHSFQFDLFAFHSYERESYDISGIYVLAEGGGDSDNDNAFNNSAVIASGVYHQHARNLLQSTVVTFSFSGEWKKKNNTLRYGSSGQWENVADNISEWEWRDSAGYSLPYQDMTQRLFYSLRGTTLMNSGRYQGYIEDNYKFDFPSTKFLISGGIRANWWSFNKDFLFSPRANFIFIPKWNKEFVFRLGTGLYYQSPFYKEVRDTITTDGVTRIQLNDRLRAQRAVHAVFGTDYYFRAIGRPFKFTAEAYYKHIDRMESYTVDNVRIRYSGKNDSKGYILGLDMKVFGELVPGVDSWVNFSLMRAKYTFVDDTTRTVLSMPQEQRYSVSLLFQDYFPKLPQLLFHIKFIWSDGLPLFSPREILNQDRMSDYRRIDIGVSYMFNSHTAAFMRAASAKHIKEWGIHFEVFNLVGWQNKISYMWVADVMGRNWAVPNYLTSRRFNVRISVNFR